MSNLKASGRCWLERVRSETGSYGSCLDRLFEEIQKGSFTPEDIGTSEEELEELRVKGCKAIAQRYLESFRSGFPPNYVDIGAFDGFREEVQKGGFTLEDIGTSEEELEELQLAWHKKK